jgi:hypothetical protein
MQDRAPDAHDAIKYVLVHVHANHRSRIVSSGQQLVYYCDDHPERVFFRQKHEKRARDEIKRLAVPCTHDKSIVRKSHDVVMMMLLMLRQINEVKMVDKNSCLFRGCEEHRLAALDA